MLTQLLIIITFVFIICGLVTIVLRFALTGRVDQPNMSTKNWLIWLFKSFFDLFKSQK